MVVLEKTLRIKVGVREVRRGRECLYGHPLGRMFRLQSPLRIVHLVRLYYNHPPPQQYAMSWNALFCSICSARQVAQRKNLKTAAFASVTSWVRLRPVNSRLPRKKWMNWLSPMMAKVRIAPVTKERCKLRPSVLH